MTNRYVAEAMVGGGSIYEVIDTAAHDPRHLMCRAHHRDALLIARALNECFDRHATMLQTVDGMRDSKRCTGR